MPHIIPFFLPFKWTYLPVYNLYVVCIKNQFLGGKKKPILLTAFGISFLKPTPKFFDFQEKKNAPFIKSLALRILLSLWARASSLSVHLTGILVCAVFSFLIRYLTLLAAVGNWKRELYVLSIILWMACHHLTF